MNKLKLAVFAGAIAAVAAISIFAAHADTTPLAVTCAGTVSSNQISWTVSASGGNAPYNFLWSGDSSVAGSTSTSIVATYGTNATYTADIQTTDASSTVATSTCSATVSANPIVAPTSTLNVFVSVDNAAGGSAVPSSFAITVSGANAAPGSFSGNSGGTAVVVNASTTYSASAFAVANYTASESGNCSGPIAAGSSDSCTITETYTATPVTPTPTSTPPLLRVNPPSLSIGPNGAFLARGMTVTSVGSGSFQAEVWGITYTINWSGNLYPQFYFRNGNGGNATSSPTTQVAVGDEVGVSGKVTSADPTVVTASVVRDYSITQPRQHPMPMPFQYGNGGNDNNGNKGGNGGGNNNSSSVNANFSARLGNLLGQLQNLQNLFKQHR